MDKAEFTVISIRDYLMDKEKSTEEELVKELSDFSCPLNPSIEQFIKKSAIEFTKKNQSVTYLIFSKRDVVLVGYFSLAIKPITVNKKKLSKTMIKKISRISEYNEEHQTFHLAAFLIAQLGKNFKDNANKKITGQQLLEIALEKIREVQYVIGCIVVFLEAEGNEKLYEFYRNQNNFTEFDVRKSKALKELELVQMLKTL